MTYDLIGGEKHGETVHLLYEVDRVDFAPMPELCATMNRSAPSNSTSSSLSYTLRKFCFYGNTYSCFALISLSDSQARNIAIKRVIA